MRAASLARGILANVNEAFSHVQHDLWHAGAFHQARSMQQQKELNRKTRRLARTLRDHTR
jgi:hypothetical protein